MSYFLQVESVPCRHHSPLHSQVLSPHLFFPLPEMTLLLAFSSPPTSAVPSVQFNSVTQSCPTPCDPMNCSMPGLPVHQQPGVYLNPCPLSRCCYPAILSSVVPFSSCPQSLPASESFLMSLIHKFPDSRSLSQRSPQVRCNTPRPHVLCFSDTKLDHRAREARTTPWVHCITGICCLLCSRHLINKKTND